MHKLRSLFPDIFAMSVIILAGMLSLADFSERVDINLTDDTGYLVLGIRIAQGALAGFGPLYSLLFKILKQFFDDPVQLYDAAMKLLMIAPPVASYIFMRALKVQKVWALPIAAFFLFSPVNMAFITWSKISHYSITGIFLWAAWASRMKEGLHIAFSLCFLTFLLGYVRPEYHLSWYLASSLLLLWWAVVNRFALKKKEALTLIPAAAFMVAFFVVIGNPMEGGRTNIAFAQQFSYNYCEWNNLNNYDWIQWRDISKKHFGEFNTLGEALNANPEVFRKHVFYNLQQYIIKGMEAVRGIFFPPSIFGMASWLAWIMIGGLMALRILHVGGRSWMHQAVEFMKEQWLLLLGLLILSAPSVIASMVFYTREHYLVLQMPLVFFIIALVLHPQQERDILLPRILTRLSLPLAAAIILLLRPGLDKYRTADVWEEYTYPSNRMTIEFVRRMGITQEVVEVDHEGGFAIYIGKNFRWATPFQKEEEPYSVFRERFKPNMYYVTKALLSNRFFNQDPEFMDIIQHPENHGLHRVDMQPENKGYLLVSDTLKYVLPKK